MAFADVFPDLLQRPTPLMRRFLRLLDEQTGGPLETLARLSQQVTRRHFGRTMRLFAPLYVSNECVNNCSYCGFSRDADILRTTLSVGQVTREARPESPEERAGSRCKSYRRSAWVLNHFGLCSLFDRFTRKM